jgi:[ribosomal protein S5]-alanine N-acetyltransferase
MDEIEFVHLFNVKEDQIIDLMNNAMVSKQLPLLIESFSKKDLQAFLKTKKQLWDEHGFGPWAFLIKDEFAGWGGLQPEQGEVDFALVLHPNFWGWGKRIFNKVKDQAFNEMNLNSFTVLLPPSRPNSKAVTRLGFRDDGQLTVGGELFMRFRLTNPHREI